MARVALKILFFTLGWFFVGVMSIMAILGFKSAVLKLRGAIDPFLNFLLGKLEDMEDEVHSA